MKLLIKAAHVIDPANSIDTVCDVLIEKKYITKIGNNIKSDDAKVIDAKGLFLIPGLVDLHVHFRDPGYEYKETIESGIQAAIKGGFVACVTMPNTKPATDNASILRDILTKAATAKFRIFPSGAITKGRAGKELTEMAEMKEAGCLAITDDGDCVADSLLFRRALEYAKMNKLVVMVHAEEHDLSKNGCMNESIVSSKMGLRGIPNAAEDVIVARDIELARLTGAHVHFQHVSTKRAVEMIRDAKKDGVNITAEAAPHHIALSDEDIVDYDTNMKMNPPLRRPEDKKAVVQGIKKGIIDAIATDHAPHSILEKDVEFDKAPFGTIGLETALAVVLTELFHSGIMSLPDVVERMSIAPQRILGVDGFAAVKEGSEANLCLFDLDKEWVVGENSFASKSSNSCFIGKTLRGKVVGTVVGGVLHEV